MVINPTDPAAFAPPEKSLPRRESILVVDDEPVILETAKRALERQGYDVLVASHGQKALSLLGKSPQIALMVVDVIMPDMSGRAIVQRALDMSSALKVIYMSGYDYATITQQGVVPNGQFFLQKPFRDVDLCQHVRDALEGRQS